MRTVQHQKIVTKSAQRTRRPTLDELDLLMDHFVNGYRANPRMVPMHKIVAAAIFETHRQGAILLQTWADYDLENEEITIRNMKHPKQTKGNDMTLSIQKEARAIIVSMPRTDDRIFPYNSDVVSRRFSDACKLLDIEDLHFHDLRHEGISRLFEIGLTIPQVAQISGHQSWQCLKRYTQIRQRGDKYEDWKWWDVVTASDIKPSPVCQNWLEAVSLTLETNEWKTLQRAFKTLNKYRHDDNVCRYLPVAPFPAPEPRRQESLQLIPPHIGPVAV